MVSDAPQPYAGRAAGQRRPAPGSARGRWALLLFMGILLAGLLAACRAGSPSPPAGEPTRSALAPTAPPASATPPPTPTPPPFRTGRAMVVCLGEEPASLYPYGIRSRSAASVLQAVYDGPIDRRGYQLYPVILEKLPSLADGDALIESVEVAAGDRVLDADGQPTLLEPGVAVRPSGCRGQDCVVTFDDQESVSMDRMSVTFRLLPGLRWSDGTPLTSRDSLYSFELAAAPETPGDKTTLDRTAQYLALDERTLRWTGLPGFLDPAYATNFWTPYPEHAWGDLSPAELLDAEISSRTPLGWGPYVLESWTPGESIRLRFNPQYHRASEGLPRFERLEFRFVGQEAATHLTRLQTGECDVVDTSAGLETASDQLLELATGGQLQAAFLPSDAWEHLVLGIRPLAYDDGWQFGDRPDYLSDPRFRQALAFCLDRQGVVDSLLAGQALLSPGFLPPGHPLTNPDLPPYAYDPQAGAALLEEAGWVDIDNDPATPRVYQGDNPQIPAGTPLVVPFLTTGAPQRQGATELLARSLAGCGLQVEVQVLDSQSLYASGPEGPLFGRRFDLAQLAWQIGDRPACHLFLGQAVPGDPALMDEDGSFRFPYGWGGWNASGYANPDYDQACEAARQALPGEDRYQERLYLVQEIFAQDLPAISLFWHLQAAAVRADMCAFPVAPGDASALWNLEAFDYGEGCEESGGQSGP